MVQNFPDTISFAPLTTQFIPNTSLEACLTAIIATAVFVNVLGGMKAVILTDVIQAGIVVVGLIVMVLNLWNDLGAKKIMHILPYILSFGPNRFLSKVLARRT